MYERRYYVYILTNPWHTVLYTGMTGGLEGRMQQHKSKKTPGFTKRYNVTKLVYYEEYAYPSEAIYREKQIKAGSRKKKIVLIESMNPEWKDLSEDWGNDNPPM
ncbi:MAG: GIY-YIG nuclease family protein [Candidatus Kerfeldbacteria bacterium]|nr:GIY-YIG nuclease family protein [Candidatus Kerfeldbacteria bacterium]